VVYLDENIGGEAFNVVIPLTRGDFIHLSENDQIFLPGWAEHAREAFAAFDTLGQLSLFSDTPTDEEAWEPKPSHLKFSRGKILYEAPNNVGTSSILRAPLFRERGIAISKSRMSSSGCPTTASCRAMSGRPGTGAPFPTAITCAMSDMSRRSSPPTPIITRNAMPASR
jgi:hypothetical protein